MIFVGESRGEMKFTTRIAGEDADDSMLENAFKNQLTVEGSVEEEIKGGFRIKLGGKRAFCPYSQMGGREKEENTSYVGRTLPFIITEYKEGGKNILVSNRKIHEAEREQHIVTLSKKITEGAIVQGTVKSIQSFGAFVEVDGFQTLLPSASPFFLPSALNRTIPQPPTFHLRTTAKPTTRLQRC